MYGGMQYLIQIPVLPIFLFEIRRDMERPYIVVCRLACSKGGRNGGICIQAIPPLRVPVVKEAVTSLDWGL